jgi:hypothetical protein
MRDLAESVNYNLQMATAERYLSQGNMTAASNTLKALASQPPKSPVDAGNWRGCLPVRVTSPPPYRWCATVLKMA